MYLSELKLWNFRQFGCLNGDDLNSSAPALKVKFNTGVNVLIGENDSGKTAIIDAIRYVLRTKSGEYIAFDEKDFYKSKDDKRTSKLKIECVFRDLTDVDAGLFLECLSVEEDEDGKKVQILKLTLTATRFENGRIFVRVFAGNGNESILIPAEVRPLLSTVYLKPLRDALQDMTHGYKSRLAQILQAHSVFESKDRDKSSGKHALEGHYENLKSTIDEYFEKPEHKGSEITYVLNDIINNHFSLNNENKNAVIKLTGNELPDILRQLDLILEDNKSGLGSLNILCIAAELLLFLEQKQGLKLTLIEELEAHIHPQLQLRLIDYFGSKGEFGQFILTTHSITLGATVPLQKLIIVKGGEAYNLDGESTKCSPEDYRFLKRFLDATKANLFFAKGVMLVEGDAENLLIPRIAQIIGRDLHQYGASIVNVGSTAYKRYVKIFQRKDGTNLNIPVAIVSDLDVRSIEYYNDKKDEVKEIFHITEEIRSKLSSDYNLYVDWNELPDYFLSSGEIDNYIVSHKIKKFASGKKSEVDAIFENSKSPVTEDIISDIRIKRRSELESEYASEIKIFLPNFWTLEYDIAKSCLAKKLAFAIELARIEKFGKDLSKEIFNKKKKEIFDSYSLPLSSQDAYDLFKPLNDGSVSKAITAQYLAELLEEDDRDEIEKDQNLKYIVDAIKHVTSL